MYFRKDHFTFFYESSISVLEIIETNNRDRFRLRASKIGQERCTRRSSQNDPVLSGCKEEGFPVNAGYDDAAQNS